MISTATPHRSSGFKSSGGMANGGTLIVTGARRFPWPARLALAVQGSVTLLASNSYSGGTTVQSGSLTISSDSALGAAGTGLAINNFATLSTGGSFSTGRGIRWDSAASSRPSPARRSPWPAPSGAAAPCR